MLNRINEFDSKINKILQNKQNQIEQLKQSFELANPQKREKAGFVEITKDGKKINFENLKKSDIIELSNTKKKLLAEIL